MLKIQKTAVWLRVGWGTLFSLLLFGSAISELAAQPSQSLDHAGRLEHLPLHFEVNSGNYPETVQYLSRNSSYTVFLTAQEAVFALHPTLKNFNARQNEVEAELLNLPQPHYVRMKFKQGRQDVKLEGLNLQTGHTRYLKGKTKSNWSKVSHFSKVRAADVYPGIDVVYHGDPKRLEYDFILKPGVDPKQIVLEFEGVERLAVAGDGGLLLQTKVGTLRHRKPLIFQSIEGENRQIQGRYVLQGKNEVGFELDDYDQRYALLIDPVLDYATYLGGKELDQGMAISVDDQGYAYVAGLSYSAYFPDQSAAKNAPSGDVDVFVAKLNPQGNQLVYSTYIGGSGYDVGYDLDVDDNGQVVVTGYTLSNDFPLVNALQKFRWGYREVFISKLNSEGDGFVYSTYLGGRNKDAGWGIKLDKAGNAYVTGYTRSDNFPVVNAVQPTFGGNNERDAFVVKISPQGDSLLYSTYFGGSGDDRAWDIDVDESGNAYITGRTESAQDFPLVNAFQTQHGADLDAFVAKLNSEGNMLLYSSYLGGDDDDVGASIAVDSSGAAYVTGYTYSDDFPTVQPLQLSRDFNRDVFISKVAPAGNELVYSTYLGGSHWDEGRGIAVDEAGNAYVAGFTLSENFPVLDSMLYTGDYWDAFILKLNSAGNSLGFSSYFGGAEDDRALGIALDSVGGIYVTGYTQSDDFPVLNPLQDTLGGSADAASDWGQQDAFIIKLAGLISIQSSPVKSATVGEPYVYAAQASGSGVTYVLTEAPLGMSINSSSGVIDWLPDSEGAFPVTLQATDDGGNVASQSYAITVAIAPQVTLLSPLNGSYTNQSTRRFSGDLNTNSAQLTLNGAPVIVATDGGFNHGPVSLIEGINSFVLLASNAAGSHQVDLSLILDTLPPAVPVTQLIGIGQPDRGNVIVSGQSGSVEANTQVIITNQRTGQVVTLTADANGAFSGQIVAEMGDIIFVQVMDAATNQSGAEQFSVDSPLPPDPVSIAPALSLTGFTSAYAANSFLFTGANPIQTGVAAGTISEKRIAVIRGKVMDRSNSPLTGVTVTIKDHPELGKTLSRADGMFDLAVNGGGYLTINYSKEGYLPVQRQVKTPWKDFVWADDVVMIPLDSNVTQINLISNAPMQVAQGSVMSDADGSRQATLMFPQGTTASMTLPDGTVQSLTTLNVRATEYTVGANGPEAMPGSLPATSAYTYAVELSVDEAIAAGAKQVNFNQPVSLYVDNFLGFPAGVVVPYGWYDFDTAAWVPAENGIVIDVLGINSITGLANIVVDNTGLVATANQLTMLGITGVELAEIAKLFQQGKSSLWRIQVDHFTPSDCNWPPPPPFKDSERPPNDKVPSTDDKNNPDTRDQSCETGCIIQTQSQTLGEDFNLVGLPSNLHYRSNRVEGRKTGRVIYIPVTGGSVPALLQSVEVEVEIAGKRQLQVFPATPNQSFEYVWDGYGSYGRKINGTVEAKITISFIYNQNYMVELNKRLADIRLGISVPNNALGSASPSFSARPSESAARFSLSVYSSDRSMILIREWRTPVRSFENKDALNVGGMSLTAHHYYNINENTLYRGDGGYRKIDIVGAKIITVAGGGQASGFSGDGGLAVNATLNSPYDVEVAEDGTVYIADSFNNRIRRIDTNGVITTIAGNQHFGQF